MGIRIGDIDIKKPIVQSGVDINEYFSGNIIGPGDFNYSGINTMIKKIIEPLIISGTSAAYMFWNCFNLTEIPQLDTSNVTNMKQMFGGCKKITTIPQLDTSNVTNMEGMFRTCSNLITIPLLNTSNVKTTESMFYECKSLTTIPQLDTSNATNTYYMFGFCSNLTTIPQLDTSKSTSMGYMFNYCDRLTEVPLLDAGNATIIEYIFQNCGSLITVGGLKDLGKAYSTTQSANYYRYELSIDSIKITEQSIINVLNNLYDIATKGCNTQTVRLGSTNLAKLTSEEGQTALANAQQKGWTIL